MKKVSIYGWLLVYLALFYGCSTTIDHETLSKDENFRDSIKTGNFIKLSVGYTYYEFENRDADTLFILVHGFSVPSYIWDSTYTAAIKRGYGVLRYDTYGRGYSDNPDTIYNVTLFSGQLQELLDSLKIAKPINLVGLSDGGRTISTFAAQNPERVENLIYVDAAGFNTFIDTIARPARVTEAQITAFKKARYETMASGQMTDFYDSIPFRGWDKKYQQLMQHKGFVRALISTNKNRTDLENDHRQIAASEIPVYAIWGEQGEVVKLEDARPNLMARIPNLKLFVIPKAGHLPHMEQTKLFNSILFDSCHVPFHILSPYDTLEYDRAVAYDYDGMSAREIVRDGRLIKVDEFRGGRIYKQKALTEEEVMRFNKIIGDTATYGGPTASCFDPHLGVVYYNKNKIVGYMSICLDCNYMRASLRIPAEYFKEGIVRPDSNQFPYSPHGFTRLGRKNINDFCKELGFPNCKEYLETTLFADYEALERILKQKGY